MDFSTPAKERISDALSRIGVPLDACKVSAIPGDLSPRRYFRLEELNSSFKKHFNQTSVMAMVFDSIKPPEAETKIIKTSDISYIEITDYFLEHKIPVPEVYEVFDDLGIIITEDLGNTPLIDLAQKQDLQLEDYYRQASRIITQLQSIKNDADFFIYKRGFDEGVYLRELSQFLEFVIPQDVSPVSKELVQQVFKWLAQELAGFNKVLVHRDFHSWNLMVDNAGNLRLIDFQDALMGVRCYDLVALLHERDIDLILPGDLIQSVENEFFSTFSDNYIREVEYPITQLQRDLKVSGLFIKVKRLRGLDSYLRWVPGTLSRIERTLDVLGSQHDLLRDFSQMLKDNGVFAK